MRTFSPREPLQLFYFFVCEFIRFLEVVAAGDDASVFVSFQA